MGSMTIAQGLRTHKRLCGELGTTQQNMQRCVSHQKGKPPTYDFNELSVKREKLSREVTALHGRILRANAATMVRDGEENVYLCEAILRLAELKGEIALLKGLNIRDGEVDQEPVFNRYEGSAIVARPPVVFETALKERERDDKVRELQLHFERLNDAVEAANHKTVLPE